MSKLRLVKITDALEKELYYQIQKKTFLFGWIAIGNRRNGLKCTFTSLDDAKKYYNAYKADQLYKIEVLENL